MKALLFLLITLVTSHLTLSLMLPRSDRPSDSSDSIRSDLTSEFTLSDKTLAPSEINTPHLHLRSTTDIIQLIRSSDPLEGAPLNPTDPIPTPLPTTIPPYKDPRDSWTFLRHSDPVCETSSASPLLSDVLHLLDLVSSRTFCDQTNRWLHGSHCTTIATYQTASLGVCGDVTKKRYFCRNSIASWRAIVHHCGYAEGRGRGEGEGRVGGSERSVVRDFRGMEMRQIAIIF